MWNFKIKNCKKEISLFLIVSLILMFFSGCSLFKKETEIPGEKISADTPWYECEIIDCVANLGEKDNLSGQIFQYPIGKISEGYVWMLQSFGDSVETKLFIFSDNGEYIADMDLNSVMKKSAAGMDEYSYFEYKDLYIKDEKLKVMYNNNTDNSIEIYDVDLLKGTVSLSSTYKLPQEEKSPYNNTEYYYRSCGEYDMFVRIGESSYILTVGPDNEVFCFSPDDSYVRDISGYVSDFIPIDDSRVIFYDYQTRIYFVYDAANGILSKETSDYDWFKPYFTERADIRYSLNNDGRVYFITSDAISYPDFENKCMNNVVLFENMDINRAIFSNGLINCIVIGADEDHVEILYSELMPEKGDYRVEILKAGLSSNNPNVGKTIITTDGYYYDSFYEAVWSFNRTDKDYFIKVVPNKYREDEIEASSSKEAWLYGSSDIGNRMMVDLMAGDCPDVVFYVSKYGQLNNGNCMMDLKPYYESGNIKDKVFDNVVGACEVNGSLYAMPLSFVLDGIIVDRSRYSNKGNGMTFDQFGEFTASYCNGLNVISNKQLDFIDKCLRFDYDLFEKDGKIDFDCKEFRELAEYTANNVYDLDWEDWYWHPSSSTVSLTTQIEGYLGWFGSVSEASYDISSADLLGLPSADGRGPSAEIRCFVSVTKGTQNPEGAWRFIETLLACDVQRGFAKPLGSYQNAFPLNKEAFDIVGAECVDIYNIQSMYKNLAKIEDLDTIKKVVNSLEHIVRSDPSVEVVVYEEIQPYLLGDKTLDEVIPIINSRAMTIVDERE